MTRRAFIKHQKVLHPDKKHSPAAVGYPGRNVHHLTPRSSGGEKTNDNELLLLVESHDAWHQLFGTRSIEEVILLLVRICRLKKRGVSCASSAVTSSARPSALGAWPS